LSAISLTLLAFQGALSLPYNGQDDLSQQSA